MVSQNRRSQEKSVIGGGFLRAFRRLFLIHFHKQAKHKTEGEQNDCDFKRQTPAVFTAELLAGEHRERSNARAECIRGVHHIERRCAAVCVFAHDAVVVVGNAALGDAGQEHRGEQQDRRAGHEQHDEADRKQIVGNEIRALETPFDDCRAGQQTDEKVADRLGGDQCSAELVVEPVGGAEIGEDGAKHDRAEAVREINEEQLSDNKTLVTADR